VPTAAELARDLELPPALVVSGLEDVAARGSAWQDAEQRWHTNGQPPVSQRTSAPEDGVSLPAPVIDPREVH
jgi:hypothetical protein